MGTEACLRMMWDNLLYTDRTGSGTYHPALAKSWDIAPDGLSWTFYLREDVFWSDGNPFNADDVVYSCNRVDENRDELVYIASYFPQYDSVEKINEYTVKINFKEPFPLAGNAFRAFFIIPKVAHEQYGDDLFNLQICTGTGPWKIVEWVTGQYIHYEKNENYYDKANFDSYFDEVYIRFVTEPATGVAAHLSGSLDVYCPSGGINNDYLSMYAGTEDRIEMIGQATNQNAYLAVQCKPESILSDMNVRKALSLSIDRQLIVDTIFGGFGSTPSGYFAPGVIGYDPSVPPYEYNPALAKQLLDASAYNGEPLEIMINPNLTRGMDMMLAVADMANSVGFNISVKLEETTVFNTRRAEADWDFFGMQVSFIDGIPARQFNLILNDPEKRNYVDEEMNSLIRRFNSEMSVDGRQSLAAQINRMLVDKVGPDIVILHFTNNYARNRGMTGRDFFYPDGTFCVAFVDYDPSMA